jgi:hypothetical protein
MVEAGIIPYRGGCGIPARSAVLLALAYRASAAVLLAGWSHIRNPLSVAAIAVAGAFGRGGDRLACAASAVEGGVGLGFVSGSSASPRKPGRLRIAVRVLSYMSLLRVIIFWTQSPPSSLVGCPFAIGIRPL